jgi:acyl-CoA synthetase
VTQPTTIGRGSWRLRSVPQHLADRYRAEGWWADATLGQMVADGLGSMGHVGFRVRSQVRPWNGTFTDVDRAARSLATEHKRLTTDGRALPGVELRLEDDGEIISRGPDCCLGYTDPELTASVFDDDGWYRTGDVGVLDDEGYLTITDRVSDIIIRGGENISAQEIEELVLGVDGVAEVSVVAAPDVRLGERAVAVVRVRAGAMAPTLDDVRAHLAAAGLARPKWPESLHVVDELPRTPSGKVQKFRLRHQLREGRLSAAT